MNKNKKIVYMLVLVNLFFSANITKCIYAEEENKSINFSTEQSEYVNVIGQTDSDLLGGEIEGISVCRIGETNLGDLVADALIDSSIELLKESPYKNLPIVSIQNGGGIRQTIPKGDITKEQINAVFPYENFLVLYEVTPKLLYEILENGVSRIFRDKNGVISGTDGRFPQVSGMKFIYDYSRPASNTFDELSYVQGSRVLAIYINGMEEPLNKQDDSTKVILAFNNYCLDGGDGYTMLKSSDIIFSGDTLNNIVCNYIFQSLNNEGIIHYEKSKHRISLGESLGMPEKDIRVFFNAQQLKFDVQPMIEDYRLFTPVRKIFEELGANVAWDETKQAVIIKKDGKEIKAFVGEKEIKVNEEVIDLDIPIKIVNNRTMVPVSFIKETLGISTDWDSQYNSLYITE